MTGSTSEIEDPLGPVGLLVEQIVQEAARGEARLEIIDLDDDTIEDGWTLDEQAYDADILKIESESIDLTQDDDEEEGQTSRPLHSGGGGESNANLRCQHYIKGARNPCLCAHHDRESEYSLGDTRVRRNNVHGLKIELRVGRFIVDFIEVKEIWVHRTTGRVLIRGFAYSRTRNLDGRLQAYKSEVCRLLEVDTNDDRPVEEQSLIEVTFEDLNPRPRVLHRTNKSFPECRFDMDVYVSNEDREELAPLTARWVHTMQYPDRRYRRAQRPIDGETLAHLREGDVSKARHRDTDAERLRKWRGDTVKGGSHVSQTVDDTVPTPDGTTTLCFPKHRYNAADMFSGAGGYTCGAKRAGIKVVCALDHWARCNATYKANHPEVELREQDIMAFCNDLTVPDVRFDLVHLSPPCQTWSPAHTCAGKNDSANIAALYACTDIIFRFRPRIVTFEQTFGIVQERHLPWFNALVQSLTKHGYSLTWKVIRLVEYGLPQTRKRLIMIGAAPGEQLPPFPAPTHAAEPEPEPEPRDGHRLHYRHHHQRKRFVSAIKACWGLVDGLNMHHPSGVKQMQRQPWDGSQPMNRTITTSGGQAYHWAGERDLTLAEFARLQGFPDNYVFKAPCVKKQIGNAFPPTVVHAIMKQIVHSLKQVDNINSDPREEDVVVLVDGDDDDDYNDQKGSEYHSGYCGALSPKHEREPEPDYPDYSGYFEEINSGRSEEASTVGSSVEERSRQMAVSRNDGINPAGDDGPHSLYSVNPTANSAPSFQNMTPLERVAWASQIAQHGLVPRGSSRQSRRRRRRRSSGGSSVVFTGQRALPTIIEDDEEEDHADGEASVGLDDGCVDAQQPPSEGTRWAGEEAGRRGGSNLVVPSSSRSSSSSSRDHQDPRELPRQDLNYQKQIKDVPAPESSPPGQSFNPFANTFGTVRSLSHWSSHKHSQSEESLLIAQQAASPSSSASVLPPVFDASQWQEDASEEDALARAIEESIKDAARLHAEMEQEAAKIGAECAFAVSGVGLGVIGTGGSGSGSGSGNPFGPLVPDQTHDEEEEEAYEGKGKGKAVAKRSFDGADEYGVKTSSLSKKGRVASD